MSFSDGNLDVAIRGAIGKEQDERVMTAELAELTSLNANDQGITDL
ncbi:hypothetical protein ACFLXP_05115 [Chloroflexota bacterium]